jgi:hypothetical protein
MRCALATAVLYPSFSARLPQRFTDGLKRGIYVALAARCLNALLNVHVE